jgi:ketosteroid isomerase-like protein
VSQDKSLGSSGAERDWLHALEDLRIAAEDYRELDDERVLVPVRFSGRGRTSGLLGQMQTKNAVLFHVRHGKVTRVVVYWDRTLVRADLGVAPEVGSDDRGRPG